MKRAGYYVAHMKAPHYGGDSGDIGGAFKTEDNARQFAREHVKTTPLGIYRVHSQGMRRDLVTTVYPQKAEAVSTHARKKSRAQLDRDIAVLVVLNSEGCR